MEKMIGKAIYRELRFSRYICKRANAGKANAQTISYQVIDVPPILQEHTQRAMTHFNADVLGLDFFCRPEMKTIICSKAMTPLALVAFQMR